MKKNAMRIRFTILLFSFVYLVLSDITAYGYDVKRNYYEIKIYHLATPAQGQKVDRYLKEAFIPAMHRAGISKIGVFRPVADSLVEKFIYVFIPYNSFEQFDQISSLLE